MYNCIFSGHCIEDICDQSCPVLAEVSYLMERNNLSMNSDVFKTDSARLDWAVKIFDDMIKEDSCLEYIPSTDSYKDSSLLTYCAICKNWKGSQLHCTVYSLNYNQYLDMTKASWSSKNKIDEDYEYMKIFTESSKYLIISGMDYVNFKEFECQTLLNILDYRRSKGLYTLVVCPSVKHLVGEGRFFNQLQIVLERATYHGSIN